VFRRRDAGAGGAVDEAATDEARSGNSQPAAERQAGGGSATTPAKGRPTPKRSEAERRRRPYSAPGDRKAGARQARTRDRGERARKYEAMKRGEDWALAPRDKGPVKALARDYVDSRRRISEYYMYILLVLLVILLLKNTALDAIVYPLVLVLVAVMVIEGFFINRGVKKLAAQRCPKESTRGVTRYAIMRALQIRRFRMPSPRVGPGAKA
jgi:Protein of unknown function (DUF3043)